MKHLCCSLAALGLACALVAVTPGLTGPARAAIGPGPGTSTPAAVPDAPYALTVSLGDDAAAMAEAGAVVDLYRVAVRSRDAAGEYVYALTEAYTSLQADFDTLMPLEEHADDTYAEAWDAFAQAAARIALPVKGNTAKKPIASKNVSGGHTVRFEGLEAGLYLAAVHGADPDYAAMTVDKRAVTHTRGDTTEFICWPQMAAVPSIDAIAIKPAIQPELSKLTVTKTLNGYVPGQAGTFVFQIEAQLADEKGTLWPVYSDVVTLTFTEGDSTKSVTIEDIPVGAEVTVTEVYTGASYTLTTDGTQTATVTADGSAGVTFANTAAAGNRGGAITNHFADDAESGWTWTPEPAAAKGAGA